jgi:hypothetical protein
MTDPHSAERMQLHDRLPPAIRQFISTMVFPPSPTEITQIFWNFHTTSDILQFLAEYDARTKAGYRELMLRCMDDFGKDKTK